jgi:hypothetical protein
MQKLGEQLVSPRQLQDAPFKLLLGVSFLQPITKNREPTMSDEIPATTPKTNVMGNDLIPAEAFPIAESKYADDKAFDVVATGGAFLPRLQLYGGNSEQCKEGKIGIGRWGIQKGKEVVDLTNQVDVLVLAWRPKAMQLGEEVIAVYNPASDEFKRIVAQSEVKDSGAMFGPEFLIYVPSQSAFVTYFANSKTARREAPQIKALMRKAATFKTQLIKTKKYSWHGPVVTPCSTPFDLPPMDDIKVQMEKFNNPPETDVEAAPDESEERDR